MYLGKAVIFVPGCLINEFYICKVTGSVPDILEQIKKINMGFSTG